MSQKSQPPVLNTSVHMLPGIGRYPVNPLPSTQTHSYQIQPLQNGFPQIHPEPRISGGYKRDHPQAQQLDILMRAFQSETLSHNSTRETMLTLRTTCNQWETNSAHERSQFLIFRDKYLEEKRKRTELESKHQSLQRDLDQMAATLAARALLYPNIGESSPVSGCISPALSPSLVIPMRSLGAGDKRKRTYCGEERAAKRLLTSPATPKAMSGLAALTT